MKTRKNLYIILGALALFFYTGGMYMILTIVKKNTPPGSQEFNYNLMSAQLWLIIAVLFFRGAYRIQRKINLQKRQALENAFAD